MTDRAPILIAGGGIAGLAAAIALAQSGRAAHILERRSEPAETGAGIQLGPNGMRVLARLGVMETLRPMAGAPEGIDIFDARRGMRLAHLPLGDTIAARHGAPYWTAHRADLHAALTTVARASARIVIEHGFEVAAVHETHADVTAIDREGRMFRGDMMIGADGLHSRTRDAMGLAAHRSGVVTHIRRGVVARHALPAAVSTGNVGVWLAPDAHLVHYPVRGGDEIALVLVDDRGAAVGRTGGAADLHATAGALIAAAGPLAVWEIEPLAPLARWTTARQVLIGDAAHPILPYLAQGGVMALEDAVTLADCLSAARDDTPAALAQFEIARRRRVARVARMSAINGRIYHLGGPAATVRNAGLRAIPGRWLLSGYDWLYGWTPPAPAPSPHPAT